MEAIAVAAGEAALSAAFDALFTKLSSQDLLKYARRNKVQSEVNRWKKELRKMNRVLDNAEERQMNEVLIKEWLDELRDLAYDVEDILDEFATQVMHEKVTVEAEASPSKVRKLIPTCCSCFSPREIKFNVSLGSKMEEITQRFQRLAKEKEDFKFIESIPRISGGALKGKLETTSLPEPHVYGREADKETLIRVLLSGEYNREPVSVVAIVGMGGLGKTTMAQLLYHDDIVKGSFDIKAWVCVSDEFDIFKITVKIIKDFTSSSCDDKDLSSVQEKLKDAVQGKKFLLILDDLWNDNYLLWEPLIRPLATGGFGSRVLITTRSEYVAATAGSVFTYRLKKLNPGECSSLLARHALGENDFSGHPELKEIGEEIAKKCDGLPLAAKAIGGLLRVKPNHKGWSKVLKSNMWELPLDNCPIMPALRVSYHCLPPHLKRCFAYCAIFPKNYVFDKDDLILLWKGEGFLEQSTNFMELGNEFFQDLLSRSFFQPSTSIFQQWTHSKFFERWADYELVWALSSLFGQLDFIPKFVMHDLMNDLAIWISERICLHLPYHKEIAPSLKFVNLRHLSFVSYDNEDAQRFEKFSPSMRLRTFIALNMQCIMESNAIFGNMRYLKVLCLSGYDIEELPDSISKLKLLRYLDMSFTKIRLLPESISDLLNLQILKLNGCPFLIQLPREIRKLINLQLLDISETDLLEEMPSGIGRLTNLQILPKFIVGENYGSRLKELKGLSLIQGELFISKLEHVVDIQDANDADLKTKEGLVSLKFQWRAHLRALEEEKHEQILAELCPHTSLKSLEIEGYNGKHLPRWVGDSYFTNLETLALWDCNNVSSLPLFGGLSSLCTLRIRCSNLTNLPNQLPLLGSLYIERCSNLTNLPNQLPSLEILNIKRSSNLKNLPKQLLSLRKLKIKECSNLINLPHEVPSLEILVIERCSNLTNLSKELLSLQTLKIEGCSNLTNLLSKFPLLGRLAIEVCSNLANLPNELCSLEILRIRECSNLTNLSNELPLLRELHIGECSNLINLPNELSSLENLWIEECSNLINLPNELSSLEVLSIHGCSNLINLPNKLHSLQTLSIVGCSNLKNLPNELHSLQTLSIVGCSNLKNLPNELPSLETLSIGICSNLTNLSNELPSLKTLSIGRCSNLTNLPNQLPSLEILRIEECSNLTNLPNQLPLLAKLSIKGCSNLTSLPNHLQEKMWTF